MMKKFQTFIMKFILILIFFSLLLLPTVLSDIVDITIEYGTTTTPVGETTTPSGDGGGNGGGGGPGVTTIPSEELVPGYSLTYSMPASFDVYQNETGIFNVEVNNEGQLSLNNIFMTVSGIAGGSYSINPGSISTLEPGHSYTFSVSIDPEKVDFGTHTLTIAITSDEKDEVASMSLDVKSYTREVAKQMEEQEKTEEEIKPRLEAIRYLLMGIVLVTGLALLNFFLGLKKGA